MRPAVAEVLRLATDADRNGHKRLEQAALRDDSNLGSIYVEAMPRYGQAAGLLTKQHLPTLLGQCVARRDPLLEQSGTQWLMHFGLSAQHGFGPQFWREIVLSHFLSGEVLTKAALAERIAGIHEQIEAKPIKLAYAGEAAGAFLGTYTKPDGLGNLGILRKGTDSYLVLDPEAPPTWAVAYALLDLWEAQFGDQVAAGLNELYGERGLTSLFMISRGRLNTMLETMQAEGMLELHLIAAPYQVLLLKRDRAWVLGKLYGTDFAE
ncbi:MAG: DUF4007 family protein [Anaerolineales bacterium]|nr:DUF4007 family protein [Anaerolineales bacterium]